MARLNWVGIPLGWHPGEAGTGRVPEDRVPVGVAGDGYAAAPEQALHQQGVAVGVFPLGEAGVNYRTGGIIHRDQQRERRRLVSQPWVMTAVQLDQHALPRHALAAHPVLGRTPSSWTAQTGVDQDAPQAIDGVVLPMSMPSRSLNNSLRWVWLAPAYLVRAKRTTPATRHRVSRWLACDPGGHG